MKSLRLLILCLFFYLTGVAQSSRIPDLERVRPMSWWTNMADPSLQLMIHGKGISSRVVKFTYPGVELVQVHKVENPNYLFIDLKIHPEAQPGAFEIYFKQSGKKDLSYKYVLNRPDTSTGRIQGVTDKDLIYLLMPDRFSNGDKTNDRVSKMKDQTLSRDSMYERHGGDLQGLMNHLDYLKNLGVTAIWCTPMLENDMKSASYHGYAATDIYKIDPRYGTNALYKKYVETCHEMGLKVIKDVVHNHIGSEGWIMEDLPMKDWVHQWPTYTNSSYRDQPVMDIHASKADKKVMLDGWFVPTMPDLNQQNPYVQKYLTQNHIWWIEYAGVDGLRLDTYPYNDPEFMAKWAKSLKKQFPHLSIFGETLVTSVAEQAFFTGGNTVNRGMDTHLPGITDATLKDAIYELLNGKDGWVDGINRLYATLSLDFLYKHPEQNIVFMDNHDMSRFYSVIQEDFDKYKQGMAILLTMRGIPQLYYGTEILMKNFSAPDGLVREDFPGGWPGDPKNKFIASGRNQMENQAFNYIRTLANFRKQTPALQDGKLMQFVPENDIYVYFRYDQQQTVMVIINTKGDSQELKTERFKERMAGFHSATDVMTQQKLQNLSTIKVQSHSATILLLEK